MSGSSQYKFGVLAKIVQHLKAIHHGGEDRALTFEEILDETNQLDIGMKISQVLQHRDYISVIKFKLIQQLLKQWLKTEKALDSNPKIEVTPDGKYKFKPPFKVRDRKGLLKLLRQTDLKGMGGILLEDIQESLPKHEKVLKV